MVDRLFAIGRWLEMNGEAIYGTTKGPFESLDFGRATTKGETLYLHIYDWPKDDSLTIPGLVTPIRSARILGGRRGALKVTGAPRKWTVHLDGEHLLEHATVLRLDLVGAPEVDTSIRSDQTGSYSLLPHQATLTGGGIRVEEIGGGENIGYWSDSSDHAAWQLKLKPGKYSVDILFAVEAGSEGSTVSVSWGEQRLGVTLSEATGAWDSYQRLPLGFINVGEESERSLLLECVEKKGVAVMNCREIRLIKLR
jgi:alpha-L-fucosidase